MCTPDMVIHKAAALGMDVDKHYDLLWIAKWALEEPLPSEWREIYGDGGSFLYERVDSGEFTQTNPNDDAFRIVYSEKVAQRPADYVPSVEERFTQFRTEEGGVYWYDWLSRESTAVKEFSHFQQFAGVHSGKTNHGTSIMYDSLENWTLPPHTEDTATDLSKLNALRDGKTDDQTRFDNPKTSQQQDGSPPLQTATDLDLDGVLLGHLSPAATDTANDLSRLDALHDDEQLQVESTQPYALEYAQREGPWTQPAIALDSASASDGSDLYNRAAVYRESVRQLADGATISAEDLARIRLERQYLETHFTREWKQRERSPTADQDASRLARDNVDSSDKLHAFAVTNSAFLNNQLENVHTDDAIWDERISDNDDSNIVENEDGLHRPATRNEQYNQRDKLQPLTSTDDRSDTDPSDSDVDAAPGDLLKQVSARSVESSWSSQSKRACPGHCCNIGTKTKESRPFSCWMLFGCAALSLLWVGMVIQDYCESDRLAQNASLLCSVILQRLFPTIIESDGAEIVASIHIKQDEPFCKAADWPLRHVPLEDILDHDEQPIPKFAELVLQRLRSLKAQEQRGLFLVDGDYKEVDTIMSNYEHGNFDVISQCNRVHELATALRIWLLQLPQSLVSKEITPTASESQFPSLAETIPDLPSTHTPLLVEVLSFVRESCSGSTGLNARDFAEILAPSIISLQVGHETAEFATSDDSNAIRTEMLFALITTLDETDMRSSLAYPVAGPNSDTEDEGPTLFAEGHTPPAALRSNDVTDALEESSLNMATNQGRVTDTNMPSESPTHEDDEKAHVESSSEIKLEAEIESDGTTFDLKEMSRPEKGSRDTFLAVGRGSALIDSAVQQNGAATDVNAFIPKQVGAREQTKHGCTCLPSTQSHRTGQVFSGCGWPKYGYCDVEPGCASAHEIDQGSGYAGWDTCLSDQEKQAIKASFVIADAAAKQFSSLDVQYLPSPLSASEYIEKKKQLRRIKQERLSHHSDEIAKFQVNLMGNTQNAEPAEIHANVDPLFASSPALQSSSLKVDAVEILDSHLKSKLPLPDSAEPTMKSAVESPSEPAVKLMGKPPWQPRTESIAIMEASSDQSLEQSVVESLEFSGEAAAECVQEPALEPAVESAGKSGDVPILTSHGKATAASMKDSAVHSVVDSMEKSSVATAGMATQQSAVKHAGRLAVQPFREFMAESMEKSTGPLVKDSMEENPRGELKLESVGQSIAESKIESVLGATKENTAQAEIWTKELPAESLRRSAGKSAVDPVGDSLSQLAEESAVEGASVHRLAKSVLSKATTTDSVENSLESPVQQSVGQSPDQSVLDSTRVLAKALLGKSMRDSAPESEDVATGLGISTIGSERSKTVKTVQLTVKSVVGEVKESAEESLKELSAKLTDGSTRDSAGRLSGQVECLDCMEPVQARAQAPAQNHVPRSTMVRVETSRVETSTVVEKENGEQLEISKSIEILTSNASTDLDSTDTLGQYHPGAMPQLQADKRHQIETVTSTRKPEIVISTKLLHDCNPGEEWTPMERCSQCAVNSFDHDRDDSSGCIKCRPGFYSPLGSVICVDVDLQYSDDDMARGDEPLRLLLTKKEQDFGYQPSSHQPMDRQIRTEMASSPVKQHKDSAATKSMVQQQASTDDILVQESWASTIGKQNREGLLQRRQQLASIRQAAAERKGRRGRNRG